jgi:hypothetical protein
MSTGADAMGVAAWLTPALIVAVAAGLAHPAVGQPADPAPPASAGPAELIDPDCDPVAAETADPLLVEEPDGTCPPEEPQDPGADPPSEPGAGSGPPADSGNGPPGDPEAGAPRGPAPGAARDEASPSATPASGTPTALAPGPGPGPRPAPGSRRRPAPAADPVRPKRRPAERPESHARDEDRGGHRDAEGQRTGAERRRAATERRAAGERRAATGHRRAVAERRRAATERRRAATERRAAAERRARAQAGRSAQPLLPSPLAGFPRTSLDAPEPLPPARRLKPRFARRLERIAERFRVPWELMLAVRRARGHDGAVPASAERLRVLARRLVRLRARKSPRRAVRRLAREIAVRANPERKRPLRRHALVRRIVALAHLNKAIGLRGLVRGLKRVKSRLARQVLDSRRLIIYPGGRHDVGSGFTDVRVLVLLRYLASRYREVTVTSLTSGHSFFTASGNVSAHSYGQAVDIAALNGHPILGNQQPRGLTERALHQIMLLPGRLEPSELISLFELGGPSFALADHADHIHVGY